ncbi:MAG: DNA methyltransferase [Conexivisphaerales archaeon]
MPSRRPSARGKTGPGLLSPNGTQSSHKALVFLDDVELGHRVEVLLQEKEQKALRKGLSELELTISKLAKDGFAMPVRKVETESLGIRSDVLLGELRQAHEARTMSRAKYYMRRLKAGLEEPKFGAINDINLRRWKEYDDVWTDSLWVMGRRDSSGAHKGWYWGNFVPQIPRQMMLRYTKSGDWVLDAFAGSGTTLIECRKLGRNGLGIELNHRVAQAARELVNTESNPKGVRTDILEGDSTSIDLGHLLSRFGISCVQMVIMHPPYHDIIKFSDDPRDLSSARDTEDFLSMFASAVDNAAPYLAQGRYFILVIGDKFARGEWIPLGFLAMERVLRRGDFMLKGIVVKNFDETRGKRSQQQLWRYRALAGGFYIFKHEYVFVFQKKDL